MLEPPSYGQPRAKRALPPHNLPERNFCAHGIPRHWACSKCGRELGDEDCQRNERHVLVELQKFYIDDGIGRSEAWGLAKKLLAALDSAVRANVMQSLTGRQREIVQLLVEGHSTKEAAVVLGISFKTAETHRAHIMRKLEIHKVSELVRYAVKSKMIEP